MWGWGGRETKTQAANQNTLAVASSDDWIIKPKTEKKDKTIYIIAYYVIEAE